MKIRSICALLVIVAALGHAAGTADQAAMAEPVEVSIMTVENYYAPAPYSNGLPIIEAYREMAEDRLGFPIVFEFITYTWANYDEQKEIVLASGSDLPWFIWNVQDHQKWGEAGVLVDLLPLIEEHAPNMRAEMAQRPILKAVPMTPDGKMYGYAMVSPPQYINGGGVNIRKDWLDKLGLEPPTTSMDLLAAVRAFRANDVNGDGENNELLISVNRSQHLTMGAWYGLQLWRSGGFQADSDGVVSYAWISPRAKEYLQMMQDLYTEGVLDPDFMQMNTEKFVARMNSNLASATIGYMGTAASYNETYDPAPGAELISLPVLIGPHGDQFMELAPGVDIPTLDLARRRSGGRDHHLRHGAQPGGRRQQPVGHRGRDLGVGRRRHAAVDGQAHQQSRRSEHRAGVQRHGRPPQLPARPLLRQLGGAVVVRPLRADARGAAVPPRGHSVHRGAADGPGGPLPWSPATCPTSRPTSTRTSPSS